MGKKLFFVVCLVIFSTFLFGSDAGEFRGETKAKIEILQKQNDQVSSKIDSLEKNIRDEYKTITDRQNERIGDIESHFNTFLTILGILAAITGYLTYTKAQANAKKEAEKWFEENSIVLNSKITNFENELNSLTNNAIQATEKHSNYLNESKQKIEEIQKNISQEKPNQNKLNNTDINNNSLHFVVDHIRSKPLNKYMFEDWNMLAFDAYNQSKLEDALFYWRNAIEIGIPLEIQNAQTLYNIAVVLMKLNRGEDAIKVYEKMIKMYIDSKNETMQELIAKALFNHGAALAEIGKSEEAIAIYNQLIHEFREVQNQIIQVERAKAYVNKGFTQGKLGNKKDEIDIYDKLVEEYQNNQNNLIQTQVAHALVNKGISLRHLNQREEAISAFDKVTEMFKETQNDEIEIQKATALLNKGAILGLLHRNIEAIAIYDEIINKYKEVQNEEIQGQRAAAYINRMEMQLVLGKEFEEPSDENIKRHLSDNRHNQLGFSMLLLLKNTLKSDQTEQIKQLKENFSDINLVEWSWIELVEWANTLESIEAKTRILTAINQFENW